MGKRGEGGFARWIAGWILYVIHVVNSNAEDMGLTMDTASRAIVLSPLRTVYRPVPALDTASSNPPPAVHTMRRYRSKLFNMAPSVQICFSRDAGYRRCCVIWRDRGRQKCCGVER